MFVLLEDQQNMFVVPPLPYVKTKLDDVIVYPYVDTSCPISAAADLVVLVKFNNEVYVSVKLIKAPPEPEFIIYPIIPPAWIFAVYVLLIPTLSRVRLIS